MAPVIASRPASRGFDLQTKATTGSVTAANGTKEKRLGEVLRGTGAFVKTITLRHVP